tara:strand:- start:198 stop:596 length:399 start_codon:yes stop_codon:yes gene_type:complete
MNIDLIYERLRKTKKYLDNDTTTNQIVNSIKKHDLFKNLDSKDILEINHEYFQNLSKYEKIYQIKNEEYKQLISQFSQAYLELCDFYVGSELPRETYLDSKKDILELFSLFILFALWEPYINAYYEKFIYKS